MKTKTATKVPCKRDPDKTRDMILSAAFEEVYRHGFQGASLDAILARAGVTKGALYHHFANKVELGYAIVDEVIMQRIQESWLDPIEQSENPVDALLGMLRTQGEILSREMMEAGCPLNNLAQEMSPLDEGFRIRLATVFERWREGIATALEKGKERNQVAKDVNTNGAAAFFVAAIEGFVGLLKSSHDMSILNSAGAELAGYLEGLRPH